MIQNSTSNKRIAKNSLIIYIDLIISSILWLIASRFLLEALGVRDFGLYNVVGSIVILLNVVNTAMISTSYRYIAYEFGKDDGNPNKVFNACRIVHLGLAIAIILFGLPIGIFYINHYLNVNGSNIADARFVYAVSVITCSISTYTVPHLGLITAVEQFAIKAGINIFRNILRLGLIVLLLYIDGNKLCIYSIFAFVTELVVAFSYILICKKKFLNIIKWTLVTDWRLFKEMISFAFWILLGAVARIGKTQGASLLVNFFYGTILNAAFAIANTVNGFVGMATNSLSQAAVPQITKSYSGGDINRSLTLVVYISKYTYILMLLVCIPFFMQTDFILNLWLTDVPEYSGTFVKLILLDALITCLGAGIPSLYQATGKIRVFQIALSVILLSSIFFGYIAYKLGYPPYSLLVVYCILSLIDRIVAVVLLKYKLKIDIGRLLRYSYLNSFKLTLAVVPLHFLNALATTEIQQFMMMLITEVILILIIYAIGVNSSERKKIHMAIKGIIRRFA